MTRWTVGTLLALAVATASAQTDGADGSSGTGAPDNGLQPIDACGTLARVGNCVVFQGGGGTFALAEFEDFTVGDAVRVTGTIDPACVTICTDVDGCIRGATLYDPALVPCGQPIPSFPEDVISDTCSSISGALTAITALGLWFTRPRRAAKRAAS
ncbi:MAG: hypothetical protein AB7Q17_17725 [Phycisphaerae bacterium]